jgi:hypothetical protein
LQLFAVGGFVVAVGLSFGLVFYSCV